MGLNELGWRQFRPTGFGAPMTVGRFPSTPNVAVRASLPTLGLAAELQLSPPDTLGFRLYGMPVSDTLVRLVCQTNEAILIF
jgi:hypothetical protein